MENKKWFICVCSDIMFNDINSFKINLLKYKKENQISFNSMVTNIANIVLFEDFDDATKQSYFEAIQSLTFSDKDTGSLFDFMTLINNYDNSVLSGKFNKDIEKIISLKIPYVFKRDYYYKLLRIGFLSSDTYKENKIYLKQIIQELKECGDNIYE